MGFAEWIICCPSPSLPSHVYRDVTWKTADIQGRTMDAEVIPTHPLCMQRAVCVE